MDVASCFRARSMFAAFPWNLAVKRSPQGQGWSAAAYALAPSLKPLCCWRQLDTVLKGVRCWGAWLWSPTSNQLCGREHGETAGGMQLPGVPGSNATFGATRPCCLWFEKEARGPQIVCSVLLFDRSICYVLISFRTCDEVSKPQPAASAARAGAFRHGTH